MSTDELTYQDTPPSGATNAQRRVAVKLQTMLPEDAEVRFVDELTATGRVQFHVSTEKWYRAAVCGCLGKRGALELTIYPLTGKRIERKGPPAWIAFRTYAC